MILHGFKISYTGHAHSRFLKSFISVHHNEAYSSSKVPAADELSLGKNVTFAQQIEVRKCLLSFGAESFVFQVAIQKFKDQDIYIEL